MRLPAEERQLQGDRLAHAPVIAVRGPAAWRMEPQDLHTVTTTQPRPAPMNHIWPIILRSVRVLCLLLEHMHAVAPPSQVAVEVNDFQLRYNGEWDNVQSSRAR